MADKDLKVYGQEVLRTLRAALVGRVAEPMSLTLNKEYGRDPYLVLIACLLSLRSRDVVTIHVCRELFTYARTPQELLRIPIKQLEKIIHKIGFFRKKAETLRSVSNELIERFGGKVPHTEQELLSLKGVGRKTANLVLSEGFNQPAICVDVHVHRLANQLGLVHTKTPEQTEYALQKIFPQKDWRDINRLLVMLGQNSKEFPLDKLFPRI